MSAPRVIGFDAVAPQRWRNGGGWTRELLAAPAGEAWHVRVSVADIEQDGPFSSFPGVARHFAVLEGAGVTLTIDGTTHRVARGGPAVAFAGAAVTACRLIDGPTRDLNLMVRGEGGVLRPVAKAEPWAPQARSCGLFATAPGQCRYGSKSIAVPAQTLVWFDRAPLQLSFDASGWWLAA